MITITSTSTVVTLNTPETLSFNTTKNVQLVKFAGGSEALFDKGKSDEFLLINGTEITNVEEKMKWLNFIMDNREVVTISGLPSIALNDSYYISELGFSREKGESCRYDWVLTLDRIYDKIIPYEAELFSPLLYDTIGLFDSIDLSETPTHLSDSINLHDTVDELLTKGYINVNYYVYGNVTDNSVPVSSATVYVQDINEGGAILEYALGASGQYQINLNGEAVDGNTIRVWCSKDGKSDEEIFTLDISGPNKKIDLELV